MGEFNKDNFISPDEFAEAYNPKQSKLLPHSCSIRVLTTVNRKTLKVKVS